MAVIAELFIKRLDLLRLVLADDQRRVAGVDHSDPRDPDETDQSVFGADETVAGIDQGCVADVGTDHRKVVDLFHDRVVDRYLAHILETVGIQSGFQLPRIDLLPFTLFQAFAAAGENVRANSLHGFDHGPGGEAEHA